eukprot:scaffold46256_cov19-Tisochrysis_lutea.AAC.3
MPTHLQVQANSMDMPSSWQPVCRCLLRRLLTGEKKFNEQSFELQTTIAKALCASGGTRHPPGHTWLKGVLCLTMQRAQFEQHSLLAGFPGGLCALLDAQSKAYAAQHPGRNYARDMLNAH